MKRTRRRAAAAGLASRRRSRPPRPRTRVPHRAPAPGARPAGPPVFEGLQGRGPTTRPRGEDDRSPEPAPWCWRRRVLRSGHFPV